MCVWKTRQSGDSEGRMNDRDEGTQSRTGLCALGLGSMGLNDLRVEGTHYLIGCKGVCGIKWGTRRTATAKTRSTTGMNPIPGIDGGGGQFD